MADADGDGEGGATRWLMASDVCKHCTHAACLDVCPTGALVRTEFGTVIVQPDVCNGCAYCVSACPFGVIDRREDDGRAWKCTMCYDRLRGGLEPACAKACPTDSIQFGPLDELRAIAQTRLDELHAVGRHAGPALRRGPGGRRRRGGRVLPAAGRARGLRAAAGPGGHHQGPARHVAAGRRWPPPPWPPAWPWRSPGGGRRAGGRRGERREARAPRWCREAEFRSYYGRPILKIPRWKAPHLPAYLYLGGLSGASAVMGAAAAATGRRALARAGRVTAAAAAMGGTGFLIAELGRPERFLHMLRVAKPTSPMSMGSWLLAAHSGLASAAAGSDLTGVAPGLGAAAGAASAVTGPLLATYAGVLLADTAVPAWHEAYRHLPFLFAGSAMASAGAAGLAATALGSGRDRGPAARMAVLGAAIELAAAHDLERSLGLTAEAYRQGEAGQLMRAARWLTPAGAVARRWPPRAAGRRRWPPPGCSRPGR